MTTSKKLWWGFGTLTALLMLFSAAIMIRVSSIDGLVREQADVARPRSEIVRKLEISVIDFAVGVHEFLQDGDARTRQEANDQAARVAREWAEYKRLAITGQQLQLAERFVVLWGEMHTVGKSLLGAEHRQPRPEDLASFHQRRLGLERFLDDDMQPEAVSTYGASRDATLQDVRAITGFVLVLLCVGSLIAIGTGVVVGRGVVHAEQALRDAHGELEERVRERTASLATANDALQRSNRELEQFASVASHDLQEPLRKIQAFGDRLQSRYRDQLGEQGHEYLDRILASAGRMRALINDLLTYSRVATKAQPFIPTGLTTVVQEAVSDLEGRMQQTGGQVDVGELPTLEADPMQMRQVFQNLIANGLKFHRPDVPPIVTVRGRLIADAEHEQNGEPSSVTFCEIAVEDNGIGFEETYLDRIFEVFQRLHGRNEYEGTGIGLAICRKIVERHGGTITAKSTPGVGSTFLVTLPVRQAEGDKAR